MSVYMPSDFRFMDNVMDMVKGCFEIDFYAPNVKAICCYYDGDPSPAVKRDYVLTVEFYEFDEDRVNGRVSEYIKSIIRREGGTRVLGGMKRNGCGQFIRTRLEFCFDKKKGV